MKAVLKKNLVRALAASGALLAILPKLGAEDPKPVQRADALQSAVEEIYVLRSVREKREQPGSVCSRGKEAARVTEPSWEDSYAFRSVTTRAADGRVVENEATPAGTIVACFGKTTEAGVLDLYGEAVINGIAAKASGKCRTAKTNFPENGVNLFGCLFELYDVPEPYVGGQLTTNSVSSSELFGTLSKPDGYTQVSIATIRLWKKRVGN